MIVSLHADRRTPAVAAVAHDLAMALQAQAPGRAVSLFVDRAAAARARGGEFVIVPRLLPPNLRPALAALGDADHAVLGLVGPVTEQVMTAFDLSERILVLTDSAVASLRTAQRTFRFCASVGYPAAKVLAVHLHGESGPGTLDCVSVARALKRDVFCGIPLAPASRPTRRAACRELAARVLGVPTGRT
jgi:hypothetical protein